MKINIDLLTSELHYTKKIDYLHDYFEDLFCEEMWDEVNESLKVIITLNLQIEVLTCVLVLISWVKSKVDNTEFWQYVYNIAKEKGVSSRNIEYITSLK